MTTIVCRDGVLAADRRVTKNNSTVGQARKIRDVLNPGGEFLGWVACSGWPSDLIAAADWLSEWPEVGEAPKRFQDGEAGGIFLLKSGDVWILGGPAPFQMDADFHATGSGFEFAMGALAMGALAMGASAVKAVEIAALFDQGTGGGVDSVP